MRLFELLDNNKVGTFHYKPKRDKLPDDMVTLFDRLGKEQRSGVEVTMMTITRKYPLMWLGYLLEHMGDLIHATSDCVNYDGAIVRDVGNKLTNASRTLDNLDANLNELAKQNKVEAERRGITEEEYVQSFMVDMEEYGEGHYNLPAYNDIHLLCKKITVSLAALEFEECAKHVNTMLGYVKDGTLNERALTITRDNNGKIVER